MKDLLLVLQGFDAGLFKAHSAGCRPQACLAASAASSNVRPSVMQGGVGTRSGAGQPQLWPTAAEAAQRCKSQQVAEGSLVSHPIVSTLHAACWHV